VARLGLTFSAPDADKRREVGVRVTSQGFEQLAEDIRVEAWELALEVVEEGLRDDQIPPLERLGRIGQLGAPAPRQPARGPRARPRA
jgi:hypothetical protein